MVSYNKYTLVPSDDPKKEVESEKTENSAFDYSSAFTYSSAFDYKTDTTVNFKSAFDYGYKKPSSSRFGDRGKKEKQWCTVMGCLTVFLTAVSYIVIGLTVPFTIWFSIKRLKQWERLIVFRLGHLRGALGPGFVFIIPWLDRHTRVDMRTKAFSVPPQQLITIDNGIIEMGCEVKYRVSDVQRLTTTVTTPQHGLRSFGKTVMLNILTKHTVRDMERDRLTIAAKVLKELNVRVLDWGIEIGEVELSSVNILKDAEPDNPLGPILNALENATGGGGKASKPHIGSAFTAPPPPTAKSNFLDFGAMAKLASLALPGSDGRKKQDRSDKSDEKPFSTCAPKTKLGKYLHNLVSGPGGTDLSQGFYRLQVEGKQGGDYVIVVTENSRQVVEGDLPKVVPDVSVNVTYEDLMSIFEGSLAPLQAYLSGRLSVQGNIQLLMGLESLKQESQNMPKDPFVV